MFELILFLPELFTVDTVDESVYRCLCMLALYSYCKTSRSILESACECTCALMHSQEDMLLWVVCARCIRWGKGGSHSGIHAGTQVHTHMLSEPRGDKRQ